MAGKRGVRVSHRELRRGLALGALAGVACWFAFSQAFVAPAWGSMVGSGALAPSAVSMQSVGGYTGFVPDMHGRQLMNFAAIAATAIPLGVLLGGYINGNPAPLATWTKNHKARRISLLAARASGTPAPGCDGTVYNILREGSGKSVEQGAKVTVHATGVVQETGKKFWSTKDPGQQPFSYRAGVGEVIKGWDQGLLGMRVGEERQVIIPGHEGYGAGGFPAWGIPPNGTLDFTLEVLSID